MEMSKSRGMAERMAEEMRNLARDEVRRRYLDGFRVLILAGPRLLLALRSRLRARRQSAKQP